ncbi:MAG: Holliday junction resolvase RuvX [Leucobacter sp.]
MRSGVRLGVDVGRARIGVAKCDPHGMLATPVETVPRDAHGDADLRRIEEIGREEGAVEIVVGLPINLQGRRTASTDDAEQFARRLADRLAAALVPVRLVDERLSTVAAQSQLREAGRRSRGSRTVIDQAAAVVILQHALDVERSSGTPPGHSVDSAASGGEGGTA